MDSKGKPVYFTDDQKPIRTGGSGKSEDISQEKWDRIFGKKEANPFVRSPREMRDKEMELEAIRDKIKAKRNPFRAKGVNFHVH